MSIIHEALKKAALEGATEATNSVSGRDALTVSTHLSAGYRRWVKIGLMILLLPFFFFSARYLSPTILKYYDQQTVPPVLPSDIHQERTLPDRAPADNPSRSNSSDEGVFQAPQVDEEERALAAGIKLYHDGKIEEASESFRKAVERFPLSSVAHNNFGMVLRHQGKTSEALNHYREAIRLDPNYAAAENNIGLVYDQAGSIDEAVIHYKRAIEIKPAVPEFHLNYATLLERKGDFSNARKEYEAYLNLETNHRSVMIPIVQSHLNKLKGF